MDEKFAPRIDNTKMEKTGERNSAYSAWHRSLGADYLAVDIDFVEYRKGRGIVAVLAVTGNCNDENHIQNSKKFIWARTSLEREILLNLSQKLSVPAYFVIHDNDLSVFHVHDLNIGLASYQRFDNTAYGTFIKQL